MTNYLGNTPVIGNFVKLDAISVVNGQAAYTMQNGGVNFVDYSSVNQFMVSLNSVIQSPGSSFTLNSSTITFASNLVTGDVIDFIIVFGNSLSSGVPTDATVSTAKIVDDAVTAAKLNNDIISGSTELASEPADTDEFLVSDAGTLKRIDYSLIKGGGKINQIVYQSTVFDSSHSSDTQVATLSITPSSASSTILIMSTIVAQLDSGEYGSVDIYRGTLASGSKVFDASDVFFHNAGDAVRCHYTFSYIDSPSTTSAQSYSIVISPQFSGTVRYGCGASNMLQLWEILP